MIDTVKGGIRRGVVDRYEIPVGFGKRQILICPKFRLLYKVVKGLAVCHGRGYMIQRQCQGRMRILMVVEVVVREIMPGQKRPLQPLGE
jgi:hypothetical protein